MAEFVYVPAGACNIGSSREEIDLCVERWSGCLVESIYTRDKFRQWILKEFPRHKVDIAPFRISRFPVTNGDYMPFLAPGTVTVPESIQKREPADHPVWGVSYEDCYRFGQWVGRKLGCKCRLPSESEWEYAARGTESREYPFGPEFDASKCNTFESGIGHTTPVDRYADYPSGFGICDMAGNVEEWTSSDYRPYPGGPYIADDLAEECGATYKVLRGGSFARGGDLARCARRHGPHPGAAFRYRGFRLVREEEDDRCPKN